jgi:hypothetical protein
MRSFFHAFLGGDSVGSWLPARRVERVLCKDCGSNLTAPRLAFPAAARSPSSSIRGTCNRTVFPHSWNFLCVLPWP